MYVVMNLGFCEDGEIINKIRVSHVFRQDFFITLLWSMPTHECREFVSLCYSAFIVGKC